MIRNLNEYRTNKAFSELEKKLRTAILLNPQAVYQLGRRPPEVMEMRYHNNPEKKMLRVYVPGESFNVFEAVWRREDEWHVEISGENIGPGVRVPIDIFLQAHEAAQETVLHYAQ